MVLPFVFRYGSYYVQQLINIESTYPGMENFLEVGGLSIQAQERHAVKTSTDQRGEQTINKLAKTTGWCLNIPFRGHAFMGYTKVWPMKNRYIPKM